MAGGLFSFGKSSSKNESQSTSSGGSFGFGGSAGSSFGSSFGQSFVDQAQAPFLDFLRNTAQGSFGGFQQQAQGAQQGFDVLGTQAGQAGALATQNPFLGDLAQQAGGNPELVQAQIGQLSDVLGQQFLEQLNPAINAGAQFAGQRGGSRQGVAQGQAIQGQQRALAQGAVGFQTADAARAQQAAIAGGQQFGQGIAQQQAGFGQQGQFLQAGQQAGFQPLQQLMQLFGAPTVLSQQGAFDQSQQFGFDINQAFQQSQATSSGKSSGFNVGFGGSSA